MAKFIALNNGKLYINIEHIVSIRDVGKDCDIRLVNGNAIVSEPAIGVLILIDNANAT